MKCHAARLLAAVTITAAAAACASTGAPAPVPVDVTGSWILNEQESDPLAARGSRGGAGGEGAPFPGQRPEGGGDPPGGRGARGSGDPRALAMAGQVMQRLRQGGASVEIRRDREAYTITFADRDAYRVAPNGKSKKTTWRGLGLVDVKAEWTVGGLLFQRELDSGVEVREVYSRVAGSPKLIVHTTIAGPLPREIEFRRVYDPAPAAP